MSRAEARRKLSNAIVELRGVHSGLDKAGSPIWKRGREPKLAAMGRIERYLRELGMDVESSRLAIEGFKTLEEYLDWIGAIP